MRWIHGIDDLAVGGLDAPVVWRLSVDEAERCTVGVRADDADLLDSAKAKYDGGAARLLRRRLLKLLTAKLTGTVPEAVRIERRASGCLRIVSPKPAFASAAGSGRQTMVAVSPVPVGADLEEHGTAFPPPYDVLTRTERQAVERTPASRRSQAFLELWTIKEAYAKAVERGLALAPDHIRTIRRDGAWTVEAIDGPAGQAEVSVDETSVAAAVVLDLK